MADASEAGGVAFGQGDSRPLRGYLARPAESRGPCPTALVVHTAEGLREFECGIARRLARHGYAALCVDLLSHRGGTDAVAAGDRFLEFADPQAPTRWVADLAAAVLFLADQPGARADAAALLGYGAGAGVAWTVASRLPDLPAALVAVDGLPVFPEEASAIEAPTLGLFAGCDRRSVAALPALERALAAVGTPVALRTFPSAHRGFYDDTRPRYRAEAETWAWQATLEWLARHAAVAA
jgi:carboxymethylenebutenolidase